MSRLNKNQISQVDSAGIADSSIVDIDISATAAIDATKIADGTVSNDDFEKISGLDSNVQDQLDAKWTLGGNATAATQSIGTTANQIINFLQNNATRMQFAIDGTVSFPGQVTANPVLGIASHVVTVTSDISTTSETPILVTGMSYTPAAGTYLCLFTGTVYQNLTATNKRIELCIYSGGVLNAASYIKIASETFMPFISIAVVTVNGSQAIEGRWCRASDGVMPTINMTGARALTTIRLS